MSAMAEDRGGRLPVMVQRETLSLKVVQGWSLGWGDVLERGWESWHAFDCSKAPFPWWHLPWRTKWPFGPMWDYSQFYLRALVSQAGMSTSLFPCPICHNQHLPGKPLPQKGRYFQYKKYSKLFRIRQTLLVFPWAPPGKARGLLHSWWVGSGSACPLPLTAISPVPLLPVATRGKCNRVWEALERVWAFQKHGTSTSVSASFHACVNSTHPGSQLGRTPGPLPLLFQSRE